MSHDEIEELRAMIERLEQEVVALADGAHDQRRAKLARHRDVNGKGWISSTVSAREFLGWTLGFLITLGGVVMGGMRLIIYPDIRSAVVAPAITEHTEAARLRMMAEVKGYVTKPEFDVIAATVAKNEVRWIAQHEELMRITEEIRKDVRALREGR